MTVAGHAGAGVLSLAVHAVALGLLALVAAPRKPEVAPPPPPSQLTVVTQQIRETSATAGTASGPTAREGTTPATPARQGAPRLTAARAAAVTGRPATAVAADAADAVDAAALAPAATRLGPTGAEAAVAAARLPPAPAARIVDTATTPRAAAVPSSRPLTQAAPASAAIAVAVPAATGVAAVAPTAKSIPDTAPDSPVAAPSPLPARRQTADLAWSGDGADRLGPQSLDAITAFTDAGDLGGAAADLRDGISDLLGGIPCARIQTTFAPETGRLVLTGHVPDAADRAPLVAALQAAVGDAIPVTGDLRILPPPQCDALAGVAAIGLPQSVEQLTNPRIIGDTGAARNYDYVAGDRLELDLAGPDYDSVVYVDYFAADGSVIHLQPNDTVPLTRLPAKAAMTIGRENAETPHLSMTIGPPFGQEIAVAMATSAPLYEGLRPLEEPAGPYLDFLRERVAAARAADPDFRGEWVYFFITTRPE